VEFFSGLLRDLHTCSGNKKNVTFVERCPKRLLYTDIELRLRNARPTRFKFLLRLILH